VAPQPKSDLGHPTVEVSRSHTHLDTHSVGLVRTSDQLVQRPLPTNRKTNTTDEHPCPQQGCCPRLQETSGHGPSENARPPESATRYSRPILNYEDTTLYVREYFILLFLITLTYNVLNAHFPIVEVFILYNYVISY
jgi:hypothetical protein